MEGRIGPWEGVLGAGDPGVGSLGSIVARTWKKAVSLSRSPARARIESLAIAAAKVPLERVEQARSYERK